MPFDKNGKYYRKPVYKVEKTKKDLPQKKNLFRRGCLIGCMGFAASLLIGFLMIVSYIIEPFYEATKPPADNSTNKENINTNKNALKGYSDIFSNLLENLENEDFLNQEIRILSEDLAKNPDAFNYVTRGGLYLLLKKYQSALNDMNKALKLEPENMDAYFYRGVIQLSMRSNTGSIKVKRGCKDINTAYKAEQQDAIYWVKDNQELLKRKQCIISK